MTHHGPEKYYLGTQSNHRPDRASSPDPDETGSPFDGQAADSDLFRVVECYRTGEDQPYQLECWRFDFKDDFRWVNGQLIELFLGRLIKMNIFGDQSPWDLLEISKDEANALIERVKTEKAGSRVEVKYYARTLGGTKDDPDFLFRARREYDDPDDDAKFSRTYEKWSPGVAGWSEDRSLMRLFYGYDDGDFFWDDLTREEAEAVIQKWEIERRGPIDPMTQPYVLRIE